MYTVAEVWNHTNSNKRKSGKIILFHAFIYERPQKR